MPWWAPVAVLCLILCSSTARVTRDADQLQVPESLLSNERNLSDEERLAAEFFKQYDADSSDMCHKSYVTEWAYASDITDENERLKTEQSLIAARFSKEAWKNITSFNWQSFQDADLKRKFKLSSVLGSSILPEEKFAEYQKQIDAMEKIYSTAKICAFNEPAKCGLSLEPEITETMQNSRDFEELKHVWTEWHKQSGGKMRKHYQRFVELSNEAATMNNFSDTGAMWMRSYESDTFKEELESVWQTVKPFYQQLHAYVRAKLRSHYGEDRVPRNEPIPAHLLGNMWAQSWSNVADLTTPYANKTSVDVTPAMLRQGYTPRRMFEISDEFFRGLGLVAMPEEFWRESIITKPEGREMVCHASAWDFCNGVDYRIKQCTRVNMEDFITVHHEMGHVEYFLQYKNQPLVYREGANPGFHEAVGDTLALAVQTTKHLKGLGLIEESAVEDHETTINYLLNTALSKIAFFPFAYIMDKWRWDVFDGSVSPDDYNCHWWKLREEYQGVRSPVTRTENDFDPGAKYHIAANVEYIRYFVSFVVQFQFYKAMCITAGEYDPADPSKPLYQCDFNNNKEAGAKLAAMLSMGSSKPWQEAMKVMTGQEKMDASALVEYFKPLEKWLVERNRELGEEVGWSAEGTPCQKELPANRRQPKERVETAEVVQQEPVKKEGTAGGQSVLLPCFSLILLAVLAAVLP